MGKKYEYFTMVKLEGGEVRVMIGKAVIHGELYGKKVEDVLYIRAANPYEGHEAYGQWTKTLMLYGITIGDLKQAYRELKELLKAGSKNVRKIEVKRWW